MSRELFISYARNDAAVATAICEGLEAAGLRCWIAPRDIPAGAEWMSEIMRALEKARVFLLVCSASSNESKQVVREVKQAIEQDCLVVPVRIDGVQLGRSLQYFLGTCQWYDASDGDLARHVPDLAATIKREIGRRHESDAPAPMPKTAPRARTVSAASMRVAVGAAIAAAIAAGSLWGTALNPIAAAFEGCDDAREQHRLRPGQRSVIRVTGKRLTSLAGTWQGRWVAALAARGLTEAGPVTVDPSGTFAQVEVNVPAEFDARCVPAPSLPLGSERCFPIKLHFDVKAALVKWKDDDLPEYRQILRRFVEHLRDHLPENVSFSEEPRFDLYDQASFRELATKIRDYDFVAASPFVYLAIQREAPAAGLKILACSRREAKSEGVVEVGHSPNSYRAFLVTSPESPLAKRLRPGEVLTPEAFRALGDVGRVELFGTNHGSTSGYVVPCLEWSRAFPGLEWQTKGSPKDVLSEVLKPDRDITRLGALNGEFIVDRPGLPPHTVVWKSADLPHGGISLVGGLHPVKAEQYPTAFDRTLQDLRDGKLKLAFSPNSDVNNVGVCNAEAYRNLGQYLERHAADTPCDLGPFAHARSMR